MSSTEQAFVQAFARHHRTETVSQTAPSARPQVPSHNASTTAAVKTWIESTEDRHTRVDEPEASLPKRHVEPRPANVNDRPQRSRTIAPEQPRVAKSVASVGLVEKPVEQPVEQPVEPSAADIARVIASLSHVDTAYVRVDSPSLASWTEVADVPAPIDETLFETIRKDDPATSTASPKMATVAEAEPLPKKQTFAVPPVAKPRRKSAPFQAAWEISVLDVPKMVADLFFRESLFQDLSDRMADAVAGEMKTVLVTSAQHGEGRSSVAVGIALAAGAAGLRVALVDADFEQPTLADDFRLDIEYGWLDTIRAGLSIREVAVLAVEDAVTFIPLVDHERTKPVTSDEVSMLVETLEDHFDLIVIDAPMGTSHHLQTLAGKVDSAIIVRDAARTKAADVEDFAGWLTKSGVQGVGVVENFVS